LIVIDDVSVDGTEKIMVKYLSLGLAVKYVKNEKNLGIAKSRNFALFLSKGKYVAVLDSDDVWVDKDKLMKQVQFMENNPDYVLYGGRAMVFDKNGKKIREISSLVFDNDIREKMLLTNQFVHSSVIYRKKTAELVGGYGEYSVGEDYDLFLKIGLKGSMGNSDEYFVNYRLHSNGATQQSRYLSAKSHLLVIRKYRGLYPHYFLSLFKAYLRIILSKLNLW
jgi:teichuronic acid biosynthesis glycosyltransferase TuaG